jgi:hypothetical protein
VGVALPSLRRLSGREPAAVPAQALRTLATGFPDKFDARVIGTSISMRVRSTEHCGTMWTSVSNVARLGLALA